jgi:hypothetical protein
MNQGQSASSASTGCLSVEAISRSGSFQAGFIA